jgi:hypothetical protein
MSRSGYGEDCCDDPLAWGRWRGAVGSAIKGERGQAMLHELVQALDAMPDKRLFPHSFATAAGEFCALGVLGAQRGTRMGDLGDEDDCSPDLVGQRFGIAPALAAEVMFLNDEGLVNPWRDGAPSQRWELMRKWAQEQLKTTAAGEKL